MSSNGRCTPSQRKWVFTRCICVARSLSMWSARSAHTFGDSAYCAGGSSLPLATIPSPEWLPNRGSLIRATLRERSSNSLASRLGSTADRCKRQPLILFNPSWPPLWHCLSSSSRPTMWFYQSGRPDARAASTVDRPLEGVHNAAMAGDDPASVSRGRLFERGVEQDLQLVGVMAAEHGALSDLQAESRLWVLPTIRRGRRPAAHRILQSGRGPERGGRGGGISCSAPVRDSPRRVDWC